MHILNSIFRNALLLGPRVRRFARLERLRPLGAVSSNRRVVPVAPKCVSHKRYLKEPLFKVCGFWT